MLQIDRHRVQVFTTIPPTQCYQDRHRGVRRPVQPVGHIPLLDRHVALSIYLFQFDLHVVRNKMNITGHPVQRGPQRGTREPGIPQCPEVGGVQELGCSEPKALVIDLVREAFPQPVQSRFVQPGIRIGDLADIDLVLPKHSFGIVSIRFDDLPGEIKRRSKDGGRHGSRSR